jgi:hypothetical protein
LGFKQTKWQKEQLAKQALKEVEGVAYVRTTLTQKNVVTELYTLKELEKQQV